MKINLLIFMAFLSVASVSGCQKTTPTTEFYQQHPAERDAMINQCQHSHSVNEACKNAHDALFLSGRFTPSQVKKW